MSVETTNETKLISGEELWEMGDIGPCELVEGRIVLMSPTGAEHGAIESELVYQLKSFVRPRKLGRVVTGEVGIYIRRSPDTIRAADVAFFSAEQLLSGLPKSYVDIAPVLVIEIVSPNDNWKDIRAKLRDYFSIGVRRVWVVEPDTHTVLVFRSATEFVELNERDLLRGEDALEGFELPVAAIFAE
jgi:Uma2 family endonuclease